MRRILQIVSLLAGLAVSNVGLGQIPDSLPRRDDFVGEILMDIYRTKIASAIEMGLDFAAYWDSDGLNAQQKKLIEGIYRSMQKRKMPANPYLLSFISTVSLAGGNELVSLTAMTSILDMTSEVLKNENSENVKAYFINLNTFLAHKALYYSNGFKLLVDNINFEFDYVTLAPEKSVDKIPDKKERDTGNKARDQAADENTGGWNDWNDEGWRSVPETESDADEWEETWDNSIETDETQSKTDGWAPVPGGDGDKALIESLVDVPMPAEKSALIRFKSTDLIFYTHYDSITIGSSKGFFSLTDGLFAGEGGSYNWTRHGMNSQDVICSLGKYAFQTSKPELISTRSKLTFPEKIANPVEGTFTFRSIKRRPETEPTYPRFLSYENNIRVYFPADKQLVFQGGFSLYGNRIYSNSLLKKNSLLEVMDGNGRQFRAMGPKFGLSDSLITSEKTSIKILYNRDSIVHPEVKLRYNPNKRELLVFRDEGVYRLSPYRISYFDMDVSADRILWDLDEDSLDISISSARNIVPAYFESNQFFNREDMKSLAGIYDFNPLIMVVQYARKIRSKKFNVFDMAHDLRQNEKEVTAAMVGILQNGFVDYNTTTGEILVKDKAFHYVDANKYLKDFDDVRIKSLSPLQPNATIRLNESEMKIRGIEKFNISEILGVFIYPQNSEITVLKNRDLKFNGQLYAGNFEFIGQNFLFKYDSFYVDLSRIDSIRFYVDDLETGKKRIVDNKLIASLDSADGKSMSGLAQTFDGSSGRLYINKPDNKSGQKIYPDYPKFNAAQGAIVYFDNPEVLDGAYDQSIYFIIPPFEIDSLSGSDPAAIGFDGIFVAENMLPSFQETLHIMNDNSLGFVHTVPPKGYELFGNGTIYDTLRLDHNGLTARGRIEYMSSSLKSDKFTFYIDSLSGDGTEFVMNKGTKGSGSFPDAYVDKFHLNWLPKKDSMYVSNLEEPFNLYDNTATLDGTLVVSTTGGSGKGILLTRGAIAKSDQLSFYESRFGARNATFEISSDNPEKPALFGEDVRLDFNLIENFADIGPEIEGEAAINFPYAQVKTSISNARWNLDERTVVMNKPEDVDIKNSHFYVTREELDSLSFNASKAVYNMDKLELLISGIPFINVADAKITPENNEILVLENARIGTLYNTTIVIDTLNEYHKLYDGTIDIISRNEFTGNATYQFVNAVNDTFGVKIDEFLLVPEQTRGSHQNVLHTQSRGYISEDQGVVISPGIVYKGEAIMYAPDPAFKLNGFVKLQYQNNPLEDLWIRYTSSETQTQEVKIDFDLARTEDDQKITAGLHYDEHDALYATFVNDKKSFMDKDFFVPKGQLTFDPDSSLYRIEDTLKVAGESYSGRIFNLNVNTSDISFEGPVNFNLITEDFKIRAAAIGKGNTKDNTYRMNAFLTFEFDLPSQAITAMSVDMLDVIDLMGIPVGYGDDPQLLYKLAEIIGEKATVDYEKKSLVEYTPLVVISSQLAKTIVIPHIDLTWSPKLKAWYSTGKISLSNINRDDVNALVDGFLEIKKNDNGDVVNLFLQFSPSSWYFFNFEDNRIITASSNDDYIDEIARRSGALKADFGEYFYLDGELNDALNFIDRFRLEYLGIKEPYELDFAPKQVFPVLQDTEEKKDETIVPDEITDEEEDDDGF